MSYGKKAKVGKYESLETHLKEIRGLEPGERVIISCTSEQATSHIRLLLYDWLHSMGLKGSFVLKRLTTKELMVQKKETPAQLIASVEKLDKRMTAQIEELIDVWNSDSAKALVESWKLNGMTEEVASALWKKVNSIMR